MRLITLPAQHTINLYQTVHELPARRHLHYNCYLVQAAGIGNTIDDVNHRLSRLGQLVAAGKQQDAAVELENLHYALHWAIEKFSPEQMAFGMLIAAVDGVPLTDFSEENLKRLLDQLSDWGLTTGMVTAEVEDVKKNSRLS
ncbi:hypothetical protein [Hymenobacter sp. YC55]|uniref:hypothetical protein n=1 Tax=Hymenobacter sp. YC55 TaxID=3034019 RepID=UPI0023F852E5|nr:hypothetical protein [Hymenobacter sp. YC55]MDF7810700.1 hypothetical protein [Hymenobacter sp. YC55]